MIQHSVIGNMKVSTYSTDEERYINRCIDFVIDMAVGRNRTE